MSPAPEWRQVRNQKKGNRNMAFSLHGIHVPHRKNTLAGQAVRMDAPQTVTIPLSMHIGVPAKAIVKVGDTVKIGTKIAEAGGAISAPIHASVSGKVVKIQDFLLSDGSTVPAIVIESDGEMASDESMVPPTITSREELIDAIRESGVVGLGGAGFPTHFKLDVDPERIEHLVINCAECEPYITSDSYTMLTRREDMAYALNILKQQLGIKSIIIGVESNKKDAISSMMQLMLNTMEGCTVQVKVLPSVYPQGGEKVLVYHTTGKIVPEGKLPIDVGCIVLNCTTLACLGTYFKTGMPLVEKCVTVDGGAIKQPQNVIAPIGSSIADVIAACQGLTTDPAKLIYGGPMMGITVPDLNAPILKNTNAVLALTEKQAWLPKTTACIRCGACANACPFHLMPADILRAYQNKDVERLNELSVLSCMECGCCSFVCPANRPLVQTNKLSKALIKEERAKEENKA